MVSAQKSRAEEILNSVPVRINDYDSAAQGRVAAPAERPPVERLPEDIQFEERGGRGGRVRPPVERLPEELPEAPREERGSGRHPNPENLPTDLPQKAAPQQKTNADWDIVEGETQRREKPKKRGGAGKEFSPYD
jgi:hypothetical protein